MGGEFAVDTSFMVALLNDEPAALSVLAPTARILVPLVVLGELYFGAEKSGRATENLKRIDASLAAMTILPTDQITSRTYARVKIALRGKGRPIPENDIWIAANALQYDLPLLTRDAHFASVDYLRTLTW